MNFLLKLKVDYILIGKYSVISELESLKKTLNKMF
jgi:hypothetical protein